MTTVAAILVFFNRLYFLFKSPRYILSSYKSTGLSVKYFKIDFQDGGNGCHPEFPINNFCYFRSTLRTKFPVDWPFSSGEKRKIDIQDDDHLGLLIQIILAIFDLQVAPKHPIRFRVNWPFH